MGSSWDLELIHVWVYGEKNNELSYSWGEFSLNRHFTKGASPPIVYRPELSIEDAEKSYFHTQFGNPGLALLRKDGMYLLAIY